MYSIHDAIMLEKYNKAHASVSRNELDTNVASLEDAPVIANILMDIINHNGKYGKTANLSNKEADSDYLAAVEREDIMR